MGRPEKFLPGRCLLPAILIALTQWGLAPSAAQATCGDYVLVGGRPAHSSVETSATNDEMNVPVDAATSPSGHIPCSGPLCSGDVPRPFGVPVAPLKIVARHWGILVVTTPPAAGESRIVPFEDDVETAPVAASSVYRPPR
jgi:hypothetical protein